MLNEWIPNSKFRPNATKCVIYNKRRQEVEIRYARNEGFLIKLVCGFRHGNCSPSICLPNLVWQENFYQDSLFWIFNPPTIIDKY